MTHVPRWATDSLDRLPHRTGRIESVEPEDGSTILRLLFPAGAVVELRVDALPDPRAAERELGVDQHPIAVLTTTDGSDLAFSVLVSTREGPTRLPLAAAAALWLLRSGTHGVVRWGR